MPDSPLSGRVALVTGAGRGLGREVARSLAGAGAMVVAADIDAVSAEETALLLKRAGHEGLGVQLDVSDAAGVSRVVDRVAGEWGLDVVVNNAGTDVTLPIDQLAVEDWDRVLAVNLRGPFLVSRQALFHLPSGGHIVNVVSTAARPRPGAWCMGDTASASVGLFLAGCF